MLKNLSLNVLLYVFFVSFSSVMAQHHNHPIAEQIDQLQIDFNQKESLPLLQLTEDQDMRKGTLADEVSDATFFKLQRTEVNHLLTEKPQALSLELPVSGRPPLQLQLFQTNVFSSEFRVVAASQKHRSFPFQAGAYYWGIVNDDDESLAGIVVTNNEVSGFIFSGGEMYTLGRLNYDMEGIHILFKESDLNIFSPFSCGTDSEEYFHGVEEGVTTTIMRGPEHCVNMYIEVDYDIFIGKGGVQEAADYVIAAFAQVALLYANEAINLNVNEVFVWDEEDPYVGPSTGDYLNQFRSGLDGNFNGDLAHLVGYNGSGGIAYVDVLCNSAFGVGYSDINASFSNVPTYSWTIEVLTHEIGHNLGSQHTHDCVWNGNNTAIDRCAAEAGVAPDCSPPAPMPEKGTIMSYCHIVSGVGIDFSLGFGPQPGDLIRSRVYNSTCLSACVPTTDYNAGITAVISPQETTCLNEVEPEIELTNFGDKKLTSVTIEYGLGGFQSEYIWTGSLAKGSSTMVVLPVVMFGSGNHTFFAATKDPNGYMDENPANDESSSSFYRPEDQTWYADTDGDGFGDLNNILAACEQPLGYVENNFDCDDNSNAVFPGAACNDGDECTTDDALNFDCECEGTEADSDSDGVCDGMDICPGGDDNLDEDGDGIPDQCNCYEAVTTFEVIPLVQIGMGVGSTYVGFDPNDKDPNFIISNLDARTNGRKSQRFIDKVSVSYVDGNGDEKTFGVFYGNIQNEVIVDIEGVVQSITVQLEDEYDGDYSGILTVDLSDVDYCLGTPPCPDSDEDGTCNIDDECPNFDDSLIGTPCEDGDECTTGETWGTNCLCAGGVYADDDGDGVCNAYDICPGGDDTTDQDEDGVPDFCDMSECGNPVGFQFELNPLEHSGAGVSYTHLIFPEVVANASFIIYNLNVKNFGHPRTRYIEEVEVTYVDGNDNEHLYGVFSAENQGTVPVTIYGNVKSIEIGLRDILDGNTGNTTMSIAVTEVSSCLPSGTPFGGSNGNSSLPSFQPRFTLFPNPAQSGVMLNFKNPPESGELILSNILGQAIAEYTFKGEDELFLNLEELQMRSQVVLISLLTPDGDCYSERLIVTR